MRVKKSIFSKVTAVATIDSSDLDNVGMFGSAAIPAPSSFAGQQAVQGVDLSKEPTASLTYCNWMESWQQASEIK